MALIEEMFTWLMTNGAYDALLPFFLIFTIIFAFLQKVNIFGDGTKKFNIIVALIIALMVVVPHVTDSYPANSDPISIVQQALPNVTIWILAIFSLFLLLAAFGMPINFGAGGEGFRGIIMIFAIIVVTLIFGQAAGWWPPSISLALGRIDSSVLQVILILAIVVGVLAWLLAEPGQGSGPKPGQALGKGLKELGKVLGGGGSS